MEYRILQKQDLPKWQEALLREAQVIAPVKRAGGEVVFTDVKNPEEITSDYINTLIPPKRFVLPQLEPILEFSSGAGGWTPEPVYDEQKRIIFGIRPCDVKAINFLDQLFGTDFKDVYYLKRRENTATICVTCQDPGENCFCICADCGPFIEDGFDIQLTDLGDDRFLVEAATERGLELISLDNTLFSEASTADVEKRNELSALAETRFKKTKTFFSAGVRKVSAEKVPEELWAELGDRCVACGGCSYACPTCSCFNIVDFRHNSNATRARCWDSCALAGFTRMAGGHNPRQKKQDRRNRRFYHKLSYYYVQRLGKHGCVGCGRCVGVCFGSIDMPAVVEMIRLDELPSTLQAKDEV